MKKLHILVLKSFIGPLILTFFFVIFILLMQFLWKYIDDLIGKGLEFSIISEFLVYTTATLVPLAMPLAVLLASLMTFGNLAENLELLAFKSSGISLFRIMVPTIILSALIAVGAFFFSDNVLPYSNLKMRSLLFDIQQQRPELTIKPGVFDNTLEGYSIKIGERDNKTKLLRDILIFDHTSKQGNVHVTWADSGYMKMAADEKHLQLTLYEGNSYYEMQKEKKSDRHIKSYPLRRDHFKEQEMIIEMTGFGLNRSDEKLFRNSYSMLNLEQLQHFDDSLTEELEGVYDKFLNTIDRTLTGKEKKILIKPKEDNMPPVRTEPSLDDILNLMESEENPENTSLARADSSKGDSVVSPVPEAELKIVPFHVDTAWNDLDLAGRRRALNQAVNFARSNKSVTASNVGTIEWKITKLRRYQIEIHKKYTLSLLCLVFFFIGAPLGAIIRKGGLGMPVIVSVLLFLLYYIIWMIGEKMARENVIPPFVGEWFAIAVFVPLSIWLTYKAANDSVVLQVDTYLSWFKKLRKRAQNNLGSQ